MNAGSSSEIEMRLLYFNRWMPIRSKLISKVSAVNHVGFGAMNYFISRVIYWLPKLQSDLIASKWKRYNSELLIYGEVL